MYILANREFPTWVDVQNGIREILYSGDRQIEGEEFEFVNEFLKRHPKYDIKTVDMVAIEVITHRPKPQFPAFPGFFIVRSDGTKEDISYKKCVSGKRGGYNHVKDHLIAYRCEIQAQIDKQKGRGKDVCACCGSTEKIQIDHVKDFIVIVNDFELFQGIQEQVIAMTDHPSIVGEKRFTDRDFAEQWQEFHRANATYQKLCGYCNRKKPKAARYRQPKQSRKINNK
ncbi:DCL family protein [Leptolyngbya sp. AN03gr2]|uniref:DCL family protein n=1 Tax=unclassified Leptolyngbya TaxID=2650499 RepID=UPI003D31E7CB